jgi:hypothetical protein
VSDVVSIDKVLFAQPEEDFFNRDLTDYSWSDAGEDQGGTVAVASQDDEVTPGT